MRALKTFSQALLTKKQSLSSVIVRLISYLLACDSLGLTPELSCVKLTILNQSRCIGFLATSFRSLSYTFGSNRVHILSAALSSWFCHCHRHNIAYAEGLVVAERLPQVSFVADLRYVLALLSKMSERFPETETRPYGPFYPSRNKACSRRRPSAWKIVVTLQGRGSAYPFLTLVLSYLSQV